MRKLTIDDSSNVSSLTYDADHITVEFRNGKAYRYAGCTIDDFASACHAPSVGSWVQVALVRQPQKHPFELVASAPHVATSPVTDTTLQMIASVPIDAPDTPAAVAEIVRAAREAVEGRAIPTPIGWSTPTVIDPGTDQAQVLWDAMPKLQRIHQLGCTPDEAEVIGRLLGSAALQARIPRR